jgi:tetratricopeptide (TPR) repeat protein
LGTKSRLATSDEDDGAPNTGSSTPERMDLPKWNRARVKRVQPADEEAPDAFQQGVREAGKTAVRRGPLVIGLLAVVAAGIGGGIWWTRSREENAAQATRLLAQPLAWRARARIVDVDAVMKDRKRPPPVPIARDQAELDRNFDTAMGALTKADHDKAAILAALVRGSSEMQRSEFAAAQGSFNDFLAKAGKDHELAPLAIEGVALAMEAQGDVDGALAKIEELTGAVGDFYRDQALWHKARLLESQGKADAALEVYRLYATEYPLDKPSLARAQVRARLTELDPSLVPAAPDRGAADLAGLLGR